MTHKATVMIIVGVVALFWTTTHDEAAAQGLTVSPANPTIFVGQAQQFTSPEVSSAADVVAGDYHACLLLENGDARCSGFNRDGQLGNGTQTDSSAPVSVLQVHQAVAVTSGGFHSCAVFRDGRVECWGMNDVGQLGDGGTTNSAIPVRVSGIRPRPLSPQGTDTRARCFQDGTVRCWGDNSYGELGDGSPINPQFSREAEAALTIPPSRLPSAASTRLSRSLRRTAITPARSFRTARSNAGATTSPVNSAMGVAPVHRHRLALPGSRGGRGQQRRFSYVRASTGRRRALLGIELLRPAR